jgi:hypothetical protein
VCGWKGFRGGLDDSIPEKKEDEFIMIEVVQKDIWWTGFGYITLGDIAEPI